LFGLLDFAVVLKALLELADLRSDIDLTIWLVRVLDEVVLVVLFGRIKNLQRRNLGDDLASEGSFLSELFEDLIDRIFLFLGLVVDHRAVPSAVIGTVGV
jgi:hypothetical protein